MLAAAEWARDSFEYAMHEAARESDRLRAALEQSRAIIHERQRGMTHWEGCEQHHSVCAVLKVIEAALADPTGR